MSNGLPPRRKGLVVSVEAPWPATNGGRARTSQVILQLAAKYDVTVIYPSDSETPHEVPSGINLLPVPGPPFPTVSDRLGVLPRLGKMTLRAIDPELRKALKELRPDFVYWSHSYLAAAGMKLTNECVNLVEFANIEGHRSLSLSRSSVHIKNKFSAFVEYLKSLWWEPRCARSASLAVSLHPQEASILGQYGAQVLLAPNGFKQNEYLPSPNKTRRVLAMGSWAYAPNRTAILRFLEYDWPRIVESDPVVELIIAGSGSRELISGDLCKIPRISTVGFVSDLTELFRDCFCFLAPASSGGGSQLKVAEALSHHRVVVGPPFIRREISPEMPSHAIVASDDIVQAVLDLASNPERRHDQERRLREYVAGRSWSDTFAPVHSWLAQSLGDVAASKEKSSH